MSLAEAKLNMECLNLSMMFWLCLLSSV